MRKPPIMTKKASSNGLMAGHAEKTGETDAGLSS